MATQSNTESDGAEVCVKCKKSPASLSRPLKRCAKCKGALYCSRECQTADWKTHKKVCNKAPTATASGNRLDGYNYFNTVAHTIPEAWELARSLNLSLPTGSERAGIA
jgi:MYND finger